MKSSQPKLSRRVVFAGAGTATALVAANAVLPGKRSAAPVAKPVAEADQAAGYRETPHVLHYYRTARV